MSFLSVVIGRRLQSSEQGDSRIGILDGVPALGLDGLSSAAYGPEAALMILLPLGLGGLHLIFPITVAILILLTLLFFSYRQTIAAYPKNGGSFTVAKENLGRQPGLLAAAALMLDYILTVAVGISAGVAAVVSAVPHIHKMTLPICLIVLAVITLLNLRGTAEAGRVFAFPTYLFILCLGGVLITGLVKSMGGHAMPAVAPPEVPKETVSVGAWLILRAFASGCAAMTGVEAVSNGVGEFKEPTVKNAQRTLTVIIVILSLLLIGIAWLCPAYHVAAMNQDDHTHPYQSVLSQLTAAIVGKGAVYYVTMFGVLAVLCLSANTSFVAFPRLCRLLAEEGALPRAFAMQGRRLVYSVGILFLTGAAAALLIAFRGITDRLIPLYAVGAFLAFTLSQAGMVMHWKNQDGSRGKMIVNGIGAVATAVALLIILSAKFIEGAWLTVIAIPLLMLSFNGVSHYYQWVRKQLAGHEEVHLIDNKPPVVVIPTRSCDRLLDKALDFALRISDDVIAVHLANVGGDEVDGQTKQLKETWETRFCAPARAAGVRAPELQIVPSPYRLWLDPLLDELQKIAAQYPDRQQAVILSQIVREHWWQRLLHDGRAVRLQRAILQRGASNIVVISVPWHLESKAGGK